MNEIVRNFVRLVIREARLPLNDREMRKVISQMGLEMLRVVNKNEDDGMFMRVYLARDLKTGEDKILKFSDDDGEWRGYRSAMTIRNKLPARVAKHLPRIYYAGMLTAYPGMIDKGAPAFTLVVMEPLVPMDRRTKDMFFHRIPHMTEEDVFFVLNKMKSNLAQTTDDEGGLRSMMDRWPKLERYMLQLGNDQLTDMNAVRQIFQRWLEGARFNDEGFRAPALDTMVRNWRHFIINSTEIDDSRQMNARGFSVTAAGESFRQLMIAMDEIGYEISDIHEGNVMVRPSTGDLVISDVGFLNAL